MKPSAPLLIEWTPTRVRIFDPVTGSTCEGASVIDCVPEAGRDAVVAVGRRSAFVRTAVVPAGSLSTTEGVLAFQMAQTLPLGPTEVVFGYRLGENVPGKGRRAAVGAVRAESLTRIDAETRAAGLRVRAVLPVAFGSWLAARAAGLRDVAVAAYANGVLDVDLVKEGELVASRSVPTEDPLDEIERSFAVMEVAPLPTLALASPELSAARHEARSALEHLADLPTIDRLLFTLEPPARRAARAARRERWKSHRALVAALGAVALGAYAIGTRARVAKVSTKPTGVFVDAARARASQTEAQARLDRATQANRVLDVALRPPQTAGDILRAVANATSAEAWLTSLSVTRGAPIAVTGLALHGSDVSRLLAVVAGDPRFKEMRVLSTSKGLVGTTPVVQFTLAGIPVGTLPFDRPTKKRPTKEKKAPVKAQRPDQ